MVSETDLFIRSQKDQRFKDVLNKQNPVMLCDWNAGTPQHNMGVDSTAWVRVTFVQAVHQGSSNTLLLSTFCGQRTVQLRMCYLQTQDTKCSQWLQSQVCSEPCSLLGLMCAHHVWAWPEIIDPETSRISSREEIKAECQIFAIQDKWRWVKNMADVNQTF